MYWRFLIKPLVIISLIIFWINISLAQDNRVIKSELHEAACKGDIENVKEILKIKGIDPNFPVQLSQVLIGGIFVKCMGTPIYGAVQQGHTEIVKLLLEKGADPNLTPYCYTLLFYAAIQSRFGIVKILLEAGADPNLKSRKGETPLLAAILAGNVNNKIIKLLLEAGANLNIKDKVGKTITDIYDNSNSLHRAIMEPNAGKVKPKIEWRKKYGSLNSFLLLATLVGNENKEVVKLLLEKGANPNIQNKDGKTPLHIAVSEENTRLVNILLSQKNIKKNVVDNNKKSPVAYSLTKDMALLLGKDDFVIESEKVFNNRIKITPSFDYSILWPKDVSVLFIGEHHGVPEFKAEIAKLVEEFKKAKIITHYASEFLGAKEQSIVDKYQRLLFRRGDRFLIKRVSLPGYSEIYKTAKRERVKMVGLDTDFTVDIGDLLTGDVRAGEEEGMKERNNQWVNILVKILNEKPKAKILVYCGSGHSDYDSENTPASTLLKRKKIKGNNINVRVVTLIGPQILYDGTAYEHTANGYTAKRLNILNEHFVAIVPEGKEDKAQLVGTDFIISVP